MPKPSKIIQLALPLGVFMTLGAVTIFSTTGCAKQATESQTKATQKFYQHSDSKPDPFLPKKDD
jgi:hypothetical protein